jgi:PAS domain-containing protein
MEAINQEPDSFDLLQLTDGRSFERYSRVQLVAGQNVGRVWIFRDVTERKRTEESLLLRDRAIQALHVGLIITDPRQPDNPIIYVSPGFEKLTGYCSAEALGAKLSLPSGQGHRSDGRCPVA